MTALSQGHGVIWRPSFDGGGVPARPRELVRGTFEAFGAMQQFEPKLDLSPKVGALVQSGSDGYVQTLTRPQ